MTLLRTLVAALLLCAGASCYGSGSNLAESGKGKPTLTASFPATVSPGDVEDLVLEISNPGPGDMSSVFVAFTQVGVPGSGLGNPLIAFGGRGESAAIVDISPEPDSVSDDGSVYRFPRLEEGAGMRITFSIEAPETRGPAANSVQVYDGSDLERGTGKRVATTVEG